MRKNLFFLLCLTGIIIFFLAPGCKKNKEKAAKTSEIVKKENLGDLNITFVSPKGQTSASHEAETIVVIFNQPMVSLKALSKGKTSSFLKLDPPFSGKFRWMGTKTLTFTPDKRFPYSTEIKVTIPAGIQSLEGVTLKEDFTWTFRTILPRLVRHSPRNNQKWIRLDSQILLIFNQSVQKDKAQDFISLVEVSKTDKETSLGFGIKNLSKSDLEEEKIEAFPDEAILLSPERKLKPDFTYYVEVKAGLPAKEGPLRMEKSRIFKFETFKTFKFERLEAEEKHNPYEPLRFQFSNPVVYKNFVSKIRFKPEAAIPDYYSAWEYSNSKLLITLSLQPETEYSVWIDPQLEDELGNKLREEIKLKFTTSPYPLSVTMNTGHGILEAYGGLRYPVYAVNAQEIFLQGVNVKKEDVIPLLTTKRIFWSREKFVRKNFFKIEKTLKLELTRNKRQIFPVELKELLPEKYGFIFLQLDTYLSEKWNRYPKAFLQVTELGISGKFSQDNNIIWVTELKTGLPVNEAEVEIRDDFNKVRWQGKTDKEGKVQTPGWKVLGIKSRDKWDKPRQWVFVRRGKDLAFTSSEWGTGIYPYRFGIHYDWNPMPDKIQGYVFTEKGIYRAGEKVHIKGIIRKREKGEWNLPSAHQIECEVLDPFKKSILKEKISLDSFGSFDFNLTTDEEASLGYYQIKTEIPPESKGERSTIIYSSFRIEAFRPVEFAVLLRSSKESFIFGENYQAEVRANYLFGGAMGGQKLSWHLRLNPASFTPSGHKGYVFGSQIDRWEIIGRERSRLLSSGDAYLDKEGKYKITAKLLPEKERDSVLAALEATVQGPSRRSVSSRIQTVVHRGDYYIGLKPSTSFLKKGDGLAVNIITVYPEGKIVPEKKILLKLIKREWHSVRKAGIGGGFHWMSEKKDIEIDVREIHTKNEPSQVSFLPEKSGFYLLRAEGEDHRKNKITTTTYFYVTGKDYVPWERHDDDTIELVTDKKDYQPGDVAKILVKSPYEKAKALVTVEREFILNSQVLEIHGSSQQIEIPVESAYIPNVFISILLVQGRTSSGVAERNKDIGKPSFKIGYTNLNVDPSEKRLEIDIRKDKKAYKPREKVTLNLQVKDWKGAGIEASISLAVVDLGVLNLIGYQTPDPFSQFYAQKPLSVQTSDTRLHVIGQRAYGEKGEDVGGGGEEKIMAPAEMALAEVELRGEFKATAYWNPSLSTDEEGNASLSFTLLDNLTTFRIMAIAQTLDSRFGRAESTFKVSKPLLLQPALPRFARLGDKFDAGVAIHNNSSKKGNVTLSCQAKGILLLDKDNIQRFSLAPGESREILFSFEVKKPGKALFSFRARMGEETDGLEIILPLKMPRPTETVALFENTTESVKEKIRIPDDVFLSESKIEFQAGSTALSRLKGCVDYLTDYPYLCLEQRLSSVLSYIVASDVIQDFNLSKLDRQEISKYVQDTIKEIYNYQRGNGGFGLWTDSTHDSPFISCYAVFALAKAQEAGYRVNKQRLDQAAKYLKDLLRGRLRKQNYPYSSRTWKTTQAYALYALALLNKPEPSYAEKLFTEREDLSLFGKTLLLKAFFHGKDALSTQAALLQELMNKIKVTPTKAHFEDDEGRGGGWIYSSNSRTTALILQSMIEVGSDHYLLPSIAQWLVERRKAGHWSSTQENFYVFYALNVFYRKYENIKPDFKAEVYLERELLLKEIFKDKRDKVVSAEMSLADFKPGKLITLKINKKGAGILYYEARMTYAPKHRLEPQDEGLAVYKEIKSMEGKPLESIKAGSFVVVTLRIVAPRESLFVVINDPLPAGFEAVNPIFLTESREQQRKLKQMDERTRRWWEGFNHIEIHDDKVLLFADSLTPGIHTHSYLARALTFGIFQTPGTKIEEMYSPEVFGRSTELTIKISK